MNINYNIDHKLLNLPIFKGTKGQYRRALFICISLIYHFTKHNGMCTLYQRQLSEDWDIHEKFFRQALKDLMKAKLIECVKPYDRKTQTGAVYRRDTGSIPGVLKQYPPGPKAVSPSAKVNNLNKKIKPQNDDLDQSSSVNGNLPMLTKQTEEDIIKLKNKIN